MCEDNIDKSFNELVERIKAESRNKDKLMPDLIQYFVPLLFPKKHAETSFAKKFKKLVSFSEKNVINSIDDLLHQLENNKIISRTNTTQLKIIVEKLDSKILNCVYENHNKLIKEGEKRCEQVIDNNTTTKLNDKVRETVCQSISKRWVDLGRQISMPDESLDQIEHKYSDFWRRASKVLDYFEANTPGGEQGPRLYKALIAAKRKDLAEKILPMLQQG